MLAEVQEHFFKQGVPIDLFTHFPCPVPQSSAESEYNTACTSVMDLSHFRILNNEFLNKDLYVFPEKSHIVILDSR